LTITEASAVGPVVTLKTSTQYPGKSYTVNTDATLLDNLGSPASATDTATFTGFGTPGPTEFVVVRVGDGVSALAPSTSAAVFLERRTFTDGTVVSTLPLPTAVNGANFPCTVIGPNSADGALSRSQDGKKLALYCLQVAPNINSGITMDARVVAVVDAASNIDTTTTTGSAFSGTGSSNVPRAAVIDGSNIWLVGGTVVSGSSSVFYTTLGSTADPTQVGLQPTSGRSIAIFAGQLYGSVGGTNAGLYSIGTGLPTTASTTPGTAVVTSGSPYSYALFDLNPNEAGVDTVYLADDGSGGGIKRYTLSGGVWSAPTIFTGAVRHIACFVDGPDVVCAGASGSQLVTLRDLNAGMSAKALTVLAGKPLALTAFRGVALPPVQ
jgi:hypothetical protein